MKHLLIVGGHAGSGKTTISRELVKDLSFVLLDKDTLTRPLSEACGRIAHDNPDDRESPEYLAFVRPAEYQALLDTAFDILKYVDTGVILTAPFTQELNDPAWVRSLEERCAEGGITLSMLWVTCSPSARRRRIIQRGAKRDRHKLSHWDQWVGSLCPPPNDIRTIDTSDIPRWGLREALSDVIAQPNESAH